MSENELMMSDVPWAVAWYGQRQCAWRTLNTQEDFFTLSDNYKTVQALYLTLQSMDGKLVSDCVRSGEGSWGNFALQAISENQIPQNFTLRCVPSGSASIGSGLLLTDRPRWGVTQ